MSDNVFDRIESLFDIGLMRDARVLVAGCGSGGGAVALQLAMSGIRRFTLVDNEAIGSENVIRHVCGLRYVGQRKVQALADILQDRNPKVSATKLDIDLLGFDGLRDAVEDATVVVIATDKDPPRFLLNDHCVQSKTPFVVGRVFTRGIGGDVFRYRPDSSGCLACLEGILERTPYRQGVSEIDLASEDERSRMYGMEPGEIKDSPGLNVDIAFITAFHTRFTLDVIASALPERPLYLHPIEEDYLVWGNRPVHPFNKNFQIQRISIHPQDGCLVCGGSE